MCIRQTTCGGTVFILYVDGIIISGSDDISTKTLKTYLMHNFKKKDLGTLTYFLVLEISHTKDVIYIYQKKMLRLYSHWHI